MQTLIDNGVKFLLFAHHLAILDAYENYCIKKGIKYALGCFATSCLSCIL